MPRGGVNLRPAPLPTASPEAALVGGQMLRQSGQDIARMGEMQAQIDEYRRRRKEAQDTLDAVEASTLVTRELDTYTQQSQQDPDYRNHPGRVLEKAKELEAQYKDKIQALSPEAQSRFRIETAQYTNIVNRQALEFTERRDLARVPNIVKDAQETYEAGMLESADPVQQRFHADRFQGALNLLADQGMLYPEQRNLLFRESNDKIALQQAEIVNQLEPEAALKHWKALANNEEGNPAMPVPPRQALAGLIEKSEAELTIQANQAYTMEQRAQKQYGMAHDLNERDLHNRISMVKSVVDLDVLMREVQTRALDLSERGIDGEAQRRLMSGLEAQRNALINPTVRSDPDVLMAYEAMVSEKRGNRTAAQVQHLLTQLNQERRLEDGHRNRIRGELMEELDENHFTKLPDYQPAMRQLSTILKEINPYGATSKEGQTFELMGQREFDNELRRIVAEEGPNAANAKVQQIADATMFRWGQKNLADRRLAVFSPVAGTENYWVPPTEPEPTDDEVRFRYAQMQFAIDAAVNSGQIASPVEAMAHKERIQIRLQDEQTYWKSYRALNQNVPQAQPGQKAPSWMQRTLDNIFGRGGYTPPGASKPDDAPKTFRPAGGGTP